eukprot:2484457-Ditylum_brightwellii.AAC.1
MSWSAKNCCNKQNNSSSTILNGSEVNGWHFHSRNGMVATATNSNPNLVSPALEELDESDDEADSSQNCAFKDPLYQFDTLTEVDRKLIEVYADTVQLNDGAHLNGGIPDDGEWQKQWTQLTALPRKQYNTPKGPVGRWFIEVYT